MIRNIKLAFIAVTLAAVGLVAPHVGAAGYVIGNEKGDARIGVSEVIESSAYLSGERIIVDGTVKGDLYCAGTDITLNGTVEGDVICAGMNLTIGGKVLGDVRVAGSNVTLKGSVAGSATLAGSSVTVDKAAVVKRDLTGGASTLNIDGTIERDVMLGSSIMNLSGAVGRDVNVASETISTGDGAKIGGNLTYQAENEQSVPAGVVAGQTSFTKQADMPTAEAPSIFVTFLMTLISFLVLALGVTLLFPKFVHEAASLSPRSALLAFFAGFATFMLLPFVSVLLMATIVGIPIGIVLMLLWLVMFFISGVFASYFVGGLILRKRATNALAVVALGALVLVALMIIPIVNILVFVAVVCVGMGMQVMNLRRQYSKRPYTIVAD